MSTMISEVYDALKEAGSSDEKARAATIAIAHYDSEISSTKSDLMLLKWMVGFNIALTCAILWRTFV